MDVCGMPSGGIILTNRGVRRISPSSAEEQMTVPEAMAAEAV
jgi:hypothetical protein